MKFIIHQKAPSVNTYFHMHWAKKKSIKEQWISDVSYELIVQRLAKTKFKKPVEIFYTLNFKDKRKRDLDNFGFTAHKFTCDALVNLGVLPEDNTNVVKALHFKRGNLKTNCVKVEIKESKKCN